MNATPDPVTSDLVTLGETMGLVARVGTGPFAVGAPATVSFGGAESNVAIGLSRLGHRATWVGRLGADPLGSMITEALGGAGVDVRATFETEVPTGLMLREHRTADRVRVGYYRRELAGSRLAPDDLDLELLAGARVLHLTGITPALSASAKAAVHKAVVAAREANVLISFDLNYRSALWSSVEDAAREFRTLLENADIVFAGLDEAAMLCGDGEPEQVAARIAEEGLAEVVLKLGADGALSRVDDLVCMRPALPVTAVDPVGAGDAFVAGYLSALLDGEPPEARLGRGNICGAFAASVAGDWEGLPRRHELAALDGTENVAR